MSAATDYPDLTAAAVTSVEDVLDRARADMAPLLAASRRDPLPPSPTAEPVEPAHFLAVLAANPVPRQQIAPIEPEPGIGSAVHELGVGELLRAYATGATTPSAVLTALRARWADPATTGGAMPSPRGERGTGGGVADGAGPGEPRGDSGATGSAVVAVVPDLEGAAAESDRRWASGTARPLEGIFFAVKDIIDVAGAPVTAGSRVTGNRVATADATVVARLRAAGAIPALITATTEFACGAPHNARYGAVTNPWDRERWTGGSSTGSAAALAARLVPLALGTDTGGSIRVPSAACNLTGIKPTYGLVPRTGVASLSWTLDHVGPMARSAADLRLVLRVLAGPDGHDPAAAPEHIADTVRNALGAHPAAPGAGPGAGRMPLERTVIGETPVAVNVSTRASCSSGRRPLAGIRIGVPDRWFIELCDARVLDARRRAERVLREAGAESVPVAIADAARLHDAVTIVLTCELASNQEAALDRFALYDIGTQVRIARGLVPSAVDYLRALRWRAAALRDVLAAFDRAGVDVLLTPGVGATAARLADATVEMDGERHPLQAIVGRNTGLFDYLGLPAVMMPAGFVDGLPVGVQVVGRPWGEDLCLRLAEVWQRNTDFHERRPA
ncbi:amidase [Nocardia aurantia]|uniref:Glutamyl-tRNA(Gln) amidotransferase subunit A n=1 Tax=Nocardia aurantia TaxID=2585199 RepID=A0A7K0DZP4_9NOCA|nr:amidase [Nocardia aurantia]MQY31279.1 Glutamyl-tRNA(Gln) amidotransferase subunit A [Nocardia aurantia]